MSRATARPNYADAVLYMLSDEALSAGEIIPKLPTVMLELIADALRLRRTELAAIVNRYGPNEEITYEMGMLAALFRVFTTECRDRAQAQRRASEGGPA